ncbi:MAG TPA: hypothetical protein PLH46_00855 [Caldisericia bacterium]|nr:hypothetical protein [Caldisericia bacterium]HQJ56165.1 hypothetical protein [Caldisericia bacterium]
MKKESIVNTVSIVVGFLVWLILNTVIVFVIAYFLSNIFKFDKISFFDSFIITVALFFLKTFFKSSFDDIEEE